MVGLKNGHIRKNLTQNVEPQRYNWGTQKKKKNRVRARIVLPGVSILAERDSSVTVWQHAHLSGHVLLGGLYFLPPR